MKLSVLASGSKGNCTFIDFGDLKILIDAGISYKKILSRLKNIGYEGVNIEYVFITHIHDDHVAGLRQLLKKTDVKVVLTASMYDYIKNILDLDRVVFINESICLRELKTTVLKGSHDSGDVNLYVFEKNGKEIAYVTDTGYINEKNFKKLLNKDIYIFESNHDVEMLMNGNYPHHLKRRVLSDEGHMSNETSAKYLCNFVGSKTKCIILFHLSENNNTPDLALKTLEQGLVKVNKKVDKIIISTFDNSTEVCEI